MNSMNASLYSLEFRTRTRRIAQGGMHADAKRGHGISEPKFGIGPLRENFLGFSRKTLRFGWFPVIASQQRLW